MLKQEVAFDPNPAARLSDERLDRPVLLTGTDGFSWGDGSVVFAAGPVATLSLSADPAPQSDPLDELEAFAARHLRRGCAGIAVALAYDLKHWIERLPRRLPWPTQPVLYAAAYDWSYRVDQIGGRAELVASDASSMAAATEALGGAPAAAPRALQTPRLEPRLSRRAYVEMVAATKEYIAAGDIYQANISQSFEGPFALGGAPLLFERWTTRFPTPYAAYVDGGSWKLVSNSPECFLDIRGDRIATFPIKGTREVSEAGAAEVGATLAADPKERAEHVMIVDLERNDLGRICVPGTVLVPEMQVTREFPGLVHLVSEVRGQLREGSGIADVLRATFPGGSITGAPKVRAMQIIEELEPVPRGFYTGSIGWIEPGGRARFNIAIRTAHIDRNGLSFHTGGGIVADSDPEREYRETFTKAQTLFRVLAASGVEAAAKD